MAKTKAFEEYDIHCKLCGKYLFTEKQERLGSPILRYNSKGNRVLMSDEPEFPFEYDEIKDIFLCQECIEDQKEDEKYGK